HPLVRAVASAIVSGLHETANAALARARGQRVKACTGAHSCITTVTGPMAYRHVIKVTAARLGCRGDLTSTAVQTRQIDGTVAWQYAAANPTDPCLPLIRDD
ncbi:MAG: hypothetical protein SGPRY_008976, partial [Prymnesium sp.]